MSMSRTSVKRMNKMKELLWFFFGKYQPKCCFCHHPILTPEDLDVLTDGIALGNANAQQMDVEGMTVHHNDGDHENNEPSNWKLAHTACHKQHHANEVFSGINGVAPKKMTRADFRRAA
jgi:hypothetical protein